MWLPADCCWLICFVVFVGGDRVPFRVRLSYVSLLNAGRKHGLLSKVTSHGRLNLSKMKDLRFFQCSSLMLPPYLPCERRSDVPLSGCTSAGESSDDDDNSFF